MLDLAAFWIVVAFLTQRGEHQRAERDLRLRPFGREADREVPDEHDGYLPL